MKIIKLREAIARSEPKIFLYGESGVGKTTQIASLPGRVLILSAEEGLLSLSTFIDDDRFDVVVISTIQDLAGAYREIKGDSSRWSWVVLDSLSEIAEIIIAAEKKIAADPRHAYGVMIDRINDIVRDFRGLPCGVVMLAKQESVDDVRTGFAKHLLGLPGKKAGPAMPYLFDLVLHMQCRPSRGPDGVVVETRAIKTFKDSVSEGKDRTGALEPYEEPDLGAIIEKIKEAQKGIEAKKKKDNKEKTEEQQTNEGEQ